jgi:hypothetical protein
MVENFSSTMRSMPLPTISFDGKERRAAALGRGTGHRAA